MTKICNCLLLAFIVHFDTIHCFHHPTTNLKLSRHISTALKAESNDVKESKKGSVNSRLLAEIEGTLKTTRAANESNSSSQYVKYEAVDLNGVRPSMAFLGSLFAFGMSSFAWKATETLTLAYMRQSERLMESDILIVQRLTGLMKQVIVGLGSLATGIFGVTSIGMALLGFKVLQGIISGELDPLKKEESLVGSDDPVEKAKALLEATDRELKQNTTK
mmetsp:Transcript_13913/g.20632  ORF Transcript_13913/g.20632 Transcript_13913/m.20632 type:complete len:219 (-) Transcript_13913:24-680(-)|eukprot:CAMPEP_0171456488 /NCGR_PEP_ID=MMETSP0945-20130129/2952_1 /TAXON_ID=109269 /ORGANISM="Vaucheria litorea, Strain CCMP2940" /LENGTH=218 /DNA_ID=CAMNT_0011981917 /DNA_START=42 /DNA_END=698 /DNA_ORIENTATION=-